MTQKRNDDPVIDEIRDVRLKISSNFDHDPRRLVAYYIELQARDEDRLIDRPGDPGPIDKSAADPASRSSLIKSPDGNGKGTAWTGVGENVD